MRNTGTRKILFVILFATLSVMLFCEGLERAVMSGTSDTVAIILNQTAGKDGSVSYFKPSIKNPKNSNFEYFGATVENGLGSADYILLVDKISMTATMYQIGFKGKTITFLSNGLPDDTDTYAEIILWEMNISPDSQQKLADSLPTYSQYILELMSRQIDYSISEDETGKIITVNNHEHGIWPADFPDVEKDDHGDVIFYFKSDRLYKARFKFQNATTYQAIKTELEKGASLFFLYDDGHGYGYTFPEISNEYVIDYRWD